MSKSSSPSIQFLFLKGSNLPSAVSSSSVDDYSLCPGFPLFFNSGLKILFSSLDRFFTLFSSNAVSIFFSWTCPYFDIHHSSSDALCPGVHYCFCELHSKSWLPYSFQIVRFLSDVTHSDFLPTGHYSQKCLLTYMVNSLKINSSAFKYVVSMLGSFASLLGLFRPIPSTDSSFHLFFSCVFLRN